MGFDPPGDETKTCVNIVLHLPPKPPRLDKRTMFVCHGNINDRLYVTVNINIHLFVFNCPGKKKKDV